MPSLIVALLVAVIAVMAGDFTLYYLNEGNSCCVSSVLGQLFDFDGNLYLAWWFGGLMTWALMQFEPVRHGIAICLSYLPGVDSEPVLRVRDAARWGMRLAGFIPVILLVLFVANQYLDGATLMLSSAPLAPLILILWSIPLLDTILGSWPGEAGTLAVGLPVELPSALSGRFKLRTRAVLIQLPIGTGRRRLIDVTPGAPRYKTERVSWIYFREGALSEAVAIEPLQIGSFEISGIRRWEYLRPEAVDLEQLDPDLLCDVEASSGCWADATAPDLLRSRCEQNECLVQAQWLLTLRRSLAGIHAEQHESIRQFLDAKIRGLVDDRLSDLRGRIFCFEVDGVAGLAIMHVRIDDVIPGRDHEANESGSLTRVDFENAQLFVDEAQRERLQDVLLSRSEEQLLHYVAGELESFELKWHGESSISDVVASKMYAIADVSQAPSLLDVCRQMDSDDNPDRALDRLLQDQRATVRDRQGNVRLLSETFQCWELKNGLHQSPNRSMKIARFLEEKGQHYEMLR